MAEGKDVLGSTKFKNREILVQHLLVAEDQLELLLDLQRRIMQGRAFFCFFFVFVFVASLLFFSRLVGVFNVRGFGRLNFRLEAFFLKKRKNEGTRVEAHGLGYGCRRELRYNTTKGMDLSDFGKMITLSGVLGGFITVAGNIISRNCIY